MSYNPDSFDQGSFDPNSYDFGSADPGPNPFSFADASNVPRSTLITSEAVLINGMALNGAISVTGLAEYSINGGAWVAVAGTINNGDLLRVRLNSSAAYSTTVSTTVTINAVSDTWTVTTLATPATGWNQGIVGSVLGFDYVIPGLGVVGTLGISTHS